MPRPYKTRTLSTDDAAQAYPLIRTANPKITLDDWLAYTARLAQVTDSGTAASGVVAFESKRGYIHALFAYSIGFGLGIGPVLNVENFIALDIVDRAAAVTTLIEAVEKTARQHGCGVIHTHLPCDWADAPASRTSLFARLIDAGYDRDTIGLSRRLERV